VVGICNLNRYDFNFAGREINSFTNDGTVNQFEANNTAKDYVAKVNRHLISSFLRKYVKRLSDLYYFEFYLDQMLISCTFQNENCLTDDFIPVYDFNYGMCWRFNSGRNLRGNLSLRKSGQMGWRYGLQLELYAGHSELQEKFAMTRGFRVIVFNRTNIYPIADEIGIDAATGLATNIGIRRTFINHLPAPFSNCLSTDIAEIDWSQNDALKFMHDNFITGQYYWSTTFWSLAGNWTWNWTVDYSQSVCVKLCFQKYLLQTCGCYDLTLPRSPQVGQLYAQNACVNTSQISCAKRLTNTFYNDSSLIDKCYDDCPIECFEIKYDLTVSSSSYPTEWYASVLANNSNFNTVINAYFSRANISYINYTNKFAELKNAIARVNVFYEDLRFTEVNDNPAMDIIFLLGTLGGNLGLFLGNFEL
jgi:hypothetical protein